MLLLVLSGGPSSDPYTVQTTQNINNMKEKIMLFVMDYKVCFI